VQQGTLQYCNGKASTHNDKSKLTKQAEKEVVESQENPHETKRNKTKRQYGVWTTKTMLYMFLHAAGI
jgi:t-SNARE complex subunit (syntaxin)